MRSPSCDGLVYAHRLARPVIAGSEENSPRIEGQTSDIARDQQQIDVGTAAGGEFLNMLGAFAKCETYLRRNARLKASLLRPKPSFFRRSDPMPWDAAWRLTQLAGGPVRYILASSGHIAGMINPPGGKGSAYWTNKPGQPNADDALGWRKSAERHDGSWWTDWAAWLASRGGTLTTPPAARQHR